VQAIAYADVFLIAAALTGACVLLAVTLRKPAPAAPTAEPPRTAVAAPAAATPPAAAVPPAVPVPAATPVPTRVEKFLHPKIRRAAQDRTLARS
jgi:hypothetical protein